MTSTLWYVWRMHNHAIFQNWRPDPFLAGLKAVGWLQSYAIMNQKVPDRRIVYPLVDHQGIVGYFDGVEQGGLCGARMVIKMSQSLSYILKISIGSR